LLLQTFVRVHPERTTEAQRKIVVGAFDSAAVASSALTLDLERRLRAAAPLASRKADRRHTLNLTGNMAGYSWSLNNVVWTPETPPLPVAQGERVEILFVNQTPMPCQRSCACRCAK
jgi:FtsP/CotA-like multicopper oxidase with cupredoxin domain